MRAHLRYLRYVVVHKWWVLVYGIPLGVPLGRLLVHDLSKFSPEEWGPYVRWLYDAPRGNTQYWRLRSKVDAADLEAQARGAAFKTAVDHHYDANDHHWEHWLTRPGDPTGYVMPMPATYAREMVADWCAANRAQGQHDVAGWYRKNAERIRLHPATRALVERLLAEDERP